MNILSVPFCVSVTNIVTVFQSPAEIELQGVGSPAGGTDEPQPDSKHLRTPASQKFQNEN